MPTDETRTDTGGLLHYEAEEYLANLRALSSELDRAMKAVVNRELSSLQDSVRLQREICARLAFFGHGSHARLNGNPNPDASESRPDVALEIKAAVETLLKLNKTYSALLRHSGDTLRLFAALFQGHHASAPVTSVGHTNLHTWSCEL